MALRFGTRSPEALAALKAARERIAAGNGGQPPRPGDYDVADRHRASHDQRRAMGEAVRNLDMTGLPLASGGAMTRHESGQVTVRYAAARTCELGHPAEQDGQKYCTVCGTRLAAPGLREDDDWLDPVTATMRRERREIEANYPESATGHSAGQ